MSDRWWVGAWTDRDTVQVGLRIYARLDLGSESASVLFPTFQAQVKEGWSTLLWYQAWWEETILKKQKNDNKSRQGVTTLETAHREAPGETEYGVAGEEGPLK